MAAVPADKTRRTCAHVHVLEAQTASSQLFTSSAYPDHLQVCDAVSSLSQFILKINQKVAQTTIQPLRPKIRPERIFVG